MMENVLRDRSECGGLEGAGAGARDAEMAPRDPLHHGPAFPICVIGIQWYQPGNWPPGCGNVMGPQPGSWVFIS